MRIHTTTAFVGALVLAAGTGCVTQEEFRKAQQELGDVKLEVFKLRREMEDANQRAEAERTAASDARTQDRRFQADLQETLRQLQESTRILSSRLGSANTTSRSGGRAATPTPDATPSAGSEEERAFKAAELDYNRGNYPIAAESFDLFLKGNSGSPRRSEALFFLGLSHYNQKQFDKALESFERILKEFTTSNQFLPAKLKRAQCLMKMGLKPAAVKAFKELAEGFSGTPEARTAQQELNDLGA